ncbi:RNA polymerase sigma-70 factor [Niabella insulamsoli]|uniref:RNA polymerase sigma-70 factor n=1 Tax=Niabella insulamsoli TaxID=3144874 RepID=UPI0031FDF4E4
MEAVAVLNDTKSFEKLYHLFYTKLLRFADAITNDQQVAEEAVSEVFVNIWRNRARLLEIQNLNSYLYIATKNIAVRYSIRHGRRSAREMNELEIAQAKYDHTPEDILLNKEIISEYEAAVAQLPLKCRNIYRLAKQDGLRYKEIAAILNISVKTIDAQLAIAIKKITETVRFMYKAG